MTKRWRMAAVALGVLALAVFAATQLTPSSSAAPSGPSAVSGSISFDGIWTGSEAAAFGKVIKAFNQVYPKVHVNYKPVGNNVPTVLATAIAGGHPPDMADIAQPGLIQQLATQGHLKPIDLRQGGDGLELRAGVAEARDVQRQAVRARLQGGQQVAALVQRARFQGGRRQGPRRRGLSCSAAAKTLQASGTPAYSIGGADGWTLTDLFENIYLRTFGAAKYERCPPTRSSGPTRR